MPKTGFEPIFNKILLKVEKHGNINEMSSWKEAYPNLEFEEVDVTITGRKIDWDIRSLPERAFYVKYMENPQAANVFFRIRLTNRLFKSRSIRAQSRDPERIWYMWMVGCFAASFGDFTNISWEAKRTFLSYSPYTEHGRLLDFINIDLEKLKLRF